MYADDTSIRTSTMSMTEVEVKTEENTALLMGGMCKSRLAVNSGKTQVLFLLALKSKGKK